MGRAAGRDAEARWLGVGSGGELTLALRGAFRWVGDSGTRYRYADLASWWSEPEILRSLGPALAELHEGPSPDLVLGMQSRGTLAGALVALHLGIGLVEARKDDRAAVDSDRWLVRTTPPDYRDRHLTLGFRRSLVRPGQRVLIVDDWIATGGQATAAQQLLQDAEAHHVGTAVIVDAMTDRSLRRRLAVRSLVYERELSKA